jgi:hypothetical protein
MAVKIQVEVFKVVAPCSFLVGYQSFRADVASIFRVKWLGWKKRGIDTSSG